MNNKHYAVVGLLAAAIFWIIYFIMSSQRPEYSFMTKAISELGSMDAPNRWIWNVIGYIIPGLLIAIFGYGLYKSCRLMDSSKAPLLGIVLSGLFMSLSGFFPADMDNRQSLTMLLHTIGSFGSYIGFLFAAFTYPRIWQKDKNWRAIITPVKICMWLTIIFGAWPFIFPEMPSVGQRLVFGFYFLWIVIVATNLYRSPERD